jgi:hypothetical protein
MMEGLVGLWTEVVSESGTSLSALVLSQALGAGDTHRLWDSAVSSVAVLSRVHHGGTFAHVYVQMKNTCT